MCRNVFTCVWVQAQRGQEQYMKMEKKKVEKKTHNLFIYNLE